MIGRHFLSWVALLLALSAPLLASDEDLRPRLLQDELYTEGWDYYFLFDDGTWVTVQIFISNFGPGDHRGLVIGTVTAPDSDTMVIKNGRPRDKWRFAETGYDFKLGRHRAWGSFPDYKLRLRNSKGELEIDLRAVAPPWRPLAGKAPDESHYVSMFLSQLHAEGRYRTPREREAGGPWRKLADGRGYAVRYVNSSSLSKVASSWLRFVPLQAEGVDKPLVLLLTRPDGRQSNHLALLRDDAIVWQGSGFPAKYEQAASIVANGHLIPQAISVEIEDEGYSISGTIHMRQLLQRFDFVNELKKLERIFIRFINTPLHYRFIADYDLRVTQGEKTHRLAGTGLAEFMILKYQ